MRFADPQNLWLFVPWLLIVPIRSWIEIRLQKKLGDFYAYNAQRPRLIKFILLWLAIGFYILAYARPQAGTREEEFKTEGLDVVFALDLSNSMATEDVVPSRLKKAKHIIKTFLEHLSGDRVGILGFAGSAVPVVPLTNDYDYVRQILDTLDENFIAFQGSDINNAILNAFRMIERGALTGTDEAKDLNANQLTRALIVISDGEDHDNVNYTEANRAAEMGVRIYSIGVGTESGGPIPVRDERGFLKGYKKDANGKPVVSKLSPQSLQNIASQGQGKYFLATTSEEEVLSILDDLQSFDRSTGGRRKITIYNEIYQYPLLIGIFLFMLSILITEQERNKDAFKPNEANFRSGIGVLVLVILSIQAAQAKSSMGRANSFKEYAETKKGVESMGSGLKPKALEHFAKSQAENPQDPLNHFNMGSALLDSGAAKEALPNLELAMQAEDHLLSGMAAYNLGRALQKESQPQKAIDIFQQGLNRVDALKKQGRYGPEEKELEKRLRQALVGAEQQQQKQKSQQNQENGNQGESQGQDEKDKNSNSQSEGKDKNKDDQGKDTEEKKYHIPQERKKYKAEHLTENDAKRLMQQLKEQENETTKKLNRMKSRQQRSEENSKNQSAGKDW